MQNDMRYQTIVRSHEMYDKEELIKLCSDFDLVGYVEQTMELKKSGDEYAAHCLRHKDDICSCYINGSKNLWYCHSCHASGNIIDWFTKQEGLTFPQAVEKLQTLTGVSLAPKYNASSLDFFKQLKVKKEKNLDAKTPDRAVLPISYLNQFEVDPDGPQEWIAEGISQRAIQKYGIRIDAKSNRIIYPVYDNDDRLIGVKGRTRFNNYKILGISKYLNYQKIGTTDYLQGMHENRQNIINKDEIILLEGIKSVMKISDWGFDNGVALETSLLNDQQARIIMQLGISNAVFALDNDVEYDAVLKYAKKLSHWMNVYIMYDRDGLLGDKAEKLSPCDKGEKIWRTLYEQKIRV